MARRRSPPASANPSRSVYATALGLVARRELSAAQVRQRLEARGFPSEAIQTTLERLESNGAIDDRRTARAIARTEVRRSRGPSRVRRVLEQAGLARDVVRDALQEAFADTSERDAIDRALARRYRRRLVDLTNPAEIGRMRGYLLRQGFSASAITDVLARRRRGPRGNVEPDDGEV